VDDNNWFKSSFSATSNGCVEVAINKAVSNADSIEVAVRVRDSKDRNGPVLMFTRAEWDAFTAGVLNGEFDV
jgi:hypothetical protein